MQIEFRKRMAKEAKVKLPLFPEEENPLLRLYYIFDDPNKSKLGSWLSMFITVVIVLSVTCFVVESLPQFKYWTSGIPGKGKYVSFPAFGHIETFSIVVFTIEYLVRFSIVAFAPPYNKTAGAKLYGFVFDKLNMIDIIAILPGIKI